MYDERLGWLGHAFADQRISLPKPSPPVAIYRARQRLSELLVSSTSLISKHCTLSPGWKSAKPVSRSPHSVPWPTLSTVSLCRLIEEQDPQWTSSPLRSTRKLWAAAIVPSITRHPATLVAGSPFILTGNTWAVPANSLAFRSQRLHDQCVEDCVDGCFDSRCAQSLDMSKGMCSTPEPDMDCTHAQHPHVFRPKSAEHQLSCSKLLRSPLDMTAATGSLQLTTHATWPAQAGHVTADLGSWRD